MIIRFEMEKISKSFNGRAIFKDLSFSFLPGKSYVIAGANGSGKSTLLRILCGLLRPTAGKVILEIEGKLLQHPHERGRYLGYLSFDLNLYERLTALENLSFFASLKGLNLKKNDFLELLEKVQLKEQAELNVAAFSTGMKQRLKLAFALLHRPAILLLDEPTANLDKRGKELVEEIICGQKQRGMVIVASNEPAEVEKYGEGILSLGSEPLGPGT